MSDRPQPELTRWGELVVPPEDLAYLASLLAEICDYRSGRARPAAVRQTRVTAKLAAYRDLAERGAREVAARAVALATPSPIAPPVVALSQAAASSRQEEITTEEAATLTGLTSEWARQLAAGGKVRARRVGRRTWLLNKGDVIAMSGRSKDGIGGSEVSGDDGPDPGGPGSGSAARRGQAA